MGIGNWLSAVASYPLTHLRPSPCCQFAKMVKSQSQSRKSVSSVVMDGKVRKANLVAEQVEMQLYLSKLKELVPNMPKDRKVSKVEVINNVIDYICDLQMALDHHHPLLVSVMLNNNNTTAASSSNNNSNNNTAESRQPLCVISTAA